MGEDQEEDEEEQDKKNVNGTGKKKKAKTGSQYVPKTKFWGLDDRYGGGKSNHNTIWYLSGPGNDPSIP